MLMIYRAVSHAASYHLVRYTSRMVFGWCEESPKARGWQQAVHHMLLPCLSQILSPSFTSSSPPQASQALLPLLLGHPRSLLS
mmetsp:Transcript_81601/g.143885  ORF Transcript_81601/g.143885 Transcript_81601/m.143885 type:complete len:83 (+) Transcript_81601:730-978(+)